MALTEVKKTILKVKKDNHIFSYKGRDHIIGSPDEPVDITAGILCRGCGASLQYGSISGTFYCQCFALGTLQFPVAPTVALSNAGDVEYFEPPAPISPKSRNRGGMHRTLCMSCLKPLPPPLDGESESDMCICPPTTFIGGTSSSSSKSDSSSSGHKSIPKIAARTPW